MKICSVCHTLKPITEFNKNKSKKDGYQTLCRTCSRAKSKRYYKENPTKQKQQVAVRNARIRSENAQKIIAFLLEHPCIDCGESDIRTLEFDHVTGTKIKEVSKLAGEGCSWKTVTKEIEKCEIRCANCHKKRTFVNSVRSKFLRLRDAIGSVADL